MPILERAVNVLVNGNLIDNSQMSAAASRGSGLKVLLDASYPEASHDSSSHPTSCFAGTRVQYITRVTAWAQTPPAERQFRVMWMQGPAGVGKSAIAQSCAEQVGTKLAAAFFFSRPHNRDISTRLFPSIAYQLTRKYPAYREKLDQILFDDRTLVDKSLAVQFRELILTPLEELQEEGESVEEGIIFIDGLDKCAGEEAQCTIIDLISASVRDRATPFIWAFFCRPEPRVVAQFRAAHVHDLCWPLKIRVSHEADADIELYLKDAFQKICVQYDIPSAASWPSEEDIRELVERSVGLFIYPTSVVRYVGDGGPLGPEEQLRLVLQLPSRVSGRPWSHLDAFYILIMEQIPKDMLPYTLELLLFHRYVPSELPTPVIAATILDFSLAAYGAALSRLHSVIKLKRTPDGLPKAFKFYHASFIEFLGDPERSGEFCFIRPELCAMVLVKSIKRINEGFSDVVVPWQDAKLDSEAGRFYLQDGTSATFWRIASRSKLDEDLLQRLSECDYRNMKCHLDIRTSTLKRFFDNIPPERRPKILRPYYLRFWHRLFRTGDPTELRFVLGHGDKKRGLKPVPDSSLVRTCDYKDLQPFQRRFWFNRSFRAHPAQ